MAVEEKQIQREDPMIEVVCAQFDKQLEVAEKVVLEFGNTVEMVANAKNENQFKWTCFVKLRDHIPGVSIEKAVFQLHETFTPNQAIVGEAPFEITRTGWGVFEIPITVTLDVLDNEVIVNLSHMLDFKEGGSSNSVLVSSSQKKRMSNIPEQEMHGSLGVGKQWKAPFIAVECDELARPGYDSKKAHEYDEDPETLKKKVKVLADLIKKSKNCCAYTGAGISTASGISDYATKAKNSLSKKHVVKKRGMKAQPTLGHRVLTACYHSGFLKHWVQQNHDGLPQKAGFPQSALNEIHGAWFDPSNPVVPMSGTLRGDLCEWLEEWQNKTDLCMAIGTSLCGMTADETLVRVSKLAMKKKAGKLGGVIIGIQQTQYDDIVQLRIYARIDQVLALLARELKITVPQLKTYEPNIPEGKEREKNVFVVPYDKDGELTNDKSKWTLWDLSFNSKVMVTMGPGKGYKGSVSNRKNKHDHLPMLLPFQREGHKDQGKRNRVYKMGSWWIEEAIFGRCKQLPVVNVQPRLAFPEQ